MTIEHITINTADLDASVAFYRDIIGLEVNTDLSKTAHMPIVFLSSGKEGTCVELIHNSEQPYCGCGICIGFRVDDVNSTHAAFTEKGLNPSPIVSPTPNTKFFFIEDPNGLRIQLI